MLSIKSVTYLFIYKWGCFRKYEFNKNIYFKRILYKSGGFRKYEFDKNIDNSLNLQVYKWGWKYEFDKNIYLENVLCINI